MSPMFIPGPVDVDPKVLEAQVQPMLPHRSKEFEDLYRRADQKARRLFYTQNRVFIITSSGTGCQEAAVRNLVNDRVLSCVNGAFSQRWYDVATTNGKKADRLDVVWGTAVLPDLVADALNKQKYDAITVVHNETSTGVMNPIQEIAAVVHNVSPDTLICVDAVSSAAGAKIEMDVWGIDLLLTSSQKCLALPPGLALCGVSDRALERAEEVPNRGWYFDLVRLEKHRVKNSTPATPAVSLIYALDFQLDRILDQEGLENRFARHRAMAERTWQWAENKGWPLFAQEGYRSQTMTVVTNPADFDLGDFNKFAATRDLRLANGYGDFKGKMFRVAHMGEIQMKDLEMLLTALDDYWAAK
jgi:predicted phosphoserine aminotransferase